MWEILEGRNIYMNDLRRVGKTMILRKMELEPKQGFLVVKRDLGGFHSAAEFATQAYRDSFHLLSAKKKTLRRMADFLKDLSGTEIGGIIKLPDGKAAPWKEILRRTFFDLQDVLEEMNLLMVFLWDEVPFLLDNVIKHGDPKAAEEILDTLRSLSQDYPRVRMVLTGSIGLHHILLSLRAKGYAHSPLNHMERVAPGPLEPTDAEQLARELISGIEQPCPDLNGCSRELAGSVGCVAFYIHKLASRLPNRPITIELIKQTLQEELLHPDNDWDLAHYRNRVRTYYGAEEQVVLHILDSVAVSESSLSFAAIRKQVASQSSFDDEERLRELLHLLQQDHYLNHEPSGYRFRYPLIRRWWLLNRDLTPTPELKP